MGYTYTTYKAALQILVVSNAGGDVDFDGILPSAIDYAEQRCYRELNLLSTVQTLSGTQTAIGSRNASIDNSFVVVNNINIITPAGSTPAAGKRNPLVPVSRATIDTLWPDNDTANRGVPTMFNMVDQWNMIVAPPPDAVYTIEVTGTYRPDPLSASNQTTFLSQRLPDLFMAASMIFMSSYMRNFSASGSDPAMAVNWETQYEALFKSADTEEARKHFWASSWTSQPVSSQAQPQRG